MSKTQTVKLIKLIEEFQKQSYSLHGFEFTDKLEKLKELSVSELNSDKLTGKDVKTFTETVSLIKNDLLDVELPIKVKDLQHRSLYQAVALKTRELISLRDFKEMTELALLNFLIQDFKQQRFLIKNILKSEKDLSAEIRTFLFAFGLINLFYGFFAEAKYIFRNLKNSFDFYCEGYFGLCLCAIKESDDTIMRKYKNKLRSLKADDFFRLCCTLQQKPDFSADEYFQLSKIYLDSHND